MRSVRCVLNISLQNIRKWSEDYRIWTIAVLVIILCFDSVRIMNTIAAALGNSSSLWIYPFAYSQYHMKLLYSLPIILMFCNAPFIDSNKLMILTRIGGRRYLAGQMGYIILASLSKAERQVVQPPKSRHDTCAQAGDFIPPGRQRPPYIRTCVQNRAAVR